MQHEPSIAVLVSALHLIHEPWHASLATALIFREARPNPPAFQQSVDVVLVSAPRPVEKLDGGNGSPVRGPVGPWSELGPRRRLLKSHGQGDGRQKEHRRSANRHAALLISTGWGPFTGRTPDRSHGTGGPDPRSTSDSEGKAVGEHRLRPLRARPMTASGRHPSEQTWIGNV